MFQMKKYENSTFATICSIFGGCIQMGGVMLAITLGIQGFRDGLYSDMFGGVLSGIMVFGMGFGLSKLGEAISTSKRFREVKKLIQKKNHEAEIAASVSTAIAFYRQIPCRKMLKYISSLNPDAGEQIRNGAAKTS